MVGHNYIKCTCMDRISVCEHFSQLINFPFIKFAAHALLHTVTYTVDSGHLGQGVASFTGKLSSPEVGTGNMIHRMNLSPMRFAATTTAVLQVLVNHSRIQNPRFAEKEEKPHKTYSHSW